MQSPTHRARLRPRLCAIGLAALATLHAALPRDARAEASSPRASAESTGEQVGARADEYAVKAAFLFNFFRYIKWPDSAFDGKSAPFVVTVLGKDPFGRVLDKTLDGRRSAERGFQTRRANDVETIGKCHVLYVPAGSEDLLARVRELYGDRPMLVVVESVQAVERGGHVGFFLEASKVRFAVNLDAARRAGLDLSSEMLKLARKIDPKSEEAR